MRQRNKNEKQSEANKIAIKKQYAWLLYFAKIEKFLRLSKIKTYGFKIVSLVENNDQATITIMANQYAGDEKVEVPYFVHAKIKIEDNRKKYYFKLEKIDMEMYNCHIDIYILNSDIEKE